MKRIEYIFWYGIGFVRGFVAWQPWQESGCVTLWGGGVAFGGLVDRRREAWIAAGYRMSAALDAARAAGHEVIFVGDFLDFESVSVHPDRRRGA